MKRKLLASFIVAFLAVLGSTPPILAKEPVSIDKLGYGPITDPITGEINWDQVTEITVLFDDGSYSPITEEEKQARTSINTTYEVNYGRTPYGIEVYFQELNGYPIMVDMFH